MRFESLEVRRLLAFDPLTLEARVVEDVTGDGVTSDDVGVAGWTFTLSYAWRDFVPTGEVDPVTGSPACTFQDHTEVATATSDENGRMVATVSATDPSPGACGIEFRGTGVFEHDLASTPGWREYVYNPTFKEPLVVAKYLARIVTVEPRPVDADPSLTFRSTVRVYRETSLSGIVFDDWNGDGLKDPAEPGIGGRRIGSGYDYRVQGVGPDDDIITDGDGRFTNVVAEPGGRNSIVFHSGMDDAVRLRTSRIDFPLVSGQVITDFDVGFFTKPTVRGTVFHDNDGDGTRDDDDPAYRGTIILEDPDGATQSILTNSQGEYSFTALSPGVHSLRLQANDIEGQFLTQPVEQVICNGNQSSLSFQSLSLAAFGFEGDFGVYLGQRLNGRKFDDRDGNGRFDHGSDQPIANAQIEIDLCGEAPDKFHADITATTNAGGFFSSDYVGSGRHLVRQSLSITDSATVPVDPGHYEVTVGADQPSPSFLLFGVTQQLVSGFVFDDLNSDGIWQDGAEPPAAGVTVQLSKPGGLTRTATSDSLGRYDIGHEGPGTYGLTLVLPLEALQTTPQNPTVQQIVISRLGENVEAAPFGRGSLVVNHAGDQADFNVADSVCDVDVQQAGLQCTLRAAIQFSNAKPGLQTITFHLPPAAGSTIQPSTPLPEITDPVVIDGGEAGITLLGGIAGNGLTISAGNSTVRRLTLAGFLQAGLELKTKGDNLVEETVLIGNGAQGLLIQEGSVRNTIRKNLIGTDANNADRGNEKAGIEIRAENNNLGGDLEDDGNRIAFNAAGIAFHVGFNRVQNNIIVSNREQGLLLIDGNNRVQANLIGTDRDGNALGNAGVGIWIESEENTIGGGEARLGNVIAHNQLGIEVASVASDSDNAIDNNQILGNLREGIVLRDGSDRNLVRRNHIGVDRTGLTLGNGSVGIWVASSNNMIGGLEEDAGNIVAFNGRDETVVAANPRAGYGIVVAPLPGRTTTPSGNAILRNSVRQNVGPGIDLGFDGSTPNDDGSKTPPLTPDQDTGPNARQNTPELVTLVFENKTVGRLLSAPATHYRIEFFANELVDVIDAGQGDRYLGSIDVTTDAAGYATFDVPAYSVNSEQRLTASASRLQNNNEGFETSEFSLLPPRDADTCGNVELQKIKDDLWQAIERDIGRVEQNDSVGANHLRKLAQQQSRRQPDGCIPASTDILTKFARLISVHSTAAADSGWWRDFGGLLSADFASLEATLMAGFAATLNELHLLFTDEVHYDSRLLAFEDLLGDLIVATESGVSAKWAALEALTWDQFFGSVVRLGRDLRNVDTYTKLVSDAFAFELFTKVVDPSVPVEQRIGLYMLAAVQFVGAIEGGAAVGKGLVETARLRLLGNRLSKSFADDSVLNDVLAQGMRKHVDDIANRRKVFLWQLLDGEEVPLEIMDQLGWTSAQIKALREIALDKKVFMQFRTTNPESAKWIRNGLAGTKPVDIKAKTINELDVYLGFRSEHKGLVGMKRVNTLKDPDLTPPCQQNRADDLCKKIKERYQKHVNDENELFGKLDTDKYLIDEDGRIINIKTQKPIAGDIDPVAFLDANGNNISGPQYDSLVQSLRESNAMIQHGAETNIVDDVIQALKKACDEVPPGKKCAQPGTDKWNKEVQDAIDLKRDVLVPNHIDGKEVTFEFGPDGRLRRRLVISLPDIAGEGEAADLEPVAREPMLRLFADMDIDIRRDRLTTFDLLFAEIKTRNDVKFELLTRLLRAAVPEGGIDENALNDLSPVELVGLVDSEPQGLHIDPSPVAEEQNDAEGEGDITLTASAILNKIREAVGDGGLANYRVQTKDGGGFVVFSRLAVELSLDVDGDGVAAPIDVLVVINQLNDQGAAPLSLWPSLAELRMDVSNDGYIAPIDALVIINYLNAPGFSTEAEGEPPILGEALEVPRVPGVLTGMGQPVRTAAVREVRFHASGNDPGTTRNQIDRVVPPHRNRVRSARGHGREPIETDHLFALFADDPTVCLD